MRCGISAACRNDASVPLTHHLLTGGNKFEIRLETMHSAGTLEPLLGIDTCALDELLGIAHAADTSLYQQPVTFLNVRARGVCSNQSDSRNGLTLHKEQSDEGQAAFITLPLHSDCSLNLCVGRSLLCSIQIHPLVQIFLNPSAVS